MVTNTNKSATNQTMTFNDAVWLMEATFNYYHAFTSLEYSKTTADSLFIPVSYNGFSELTTQQVTNLYHDVNNTLVQHLQPLLGSNKKPMVYDFELQATQQGPQVLIITTIGTVNTLKIANQTNSAAFDNTDYWYPTALRGKCDIYEGQYYGDYDAATKWMSKLRWTKIIPLYFYTNIITDDNQIVPEDYPGYNPYQPGHQYLLHKSSIDCLSPDKMNFYLNNIDFIVEDRIPNKKYFVNCLIKNLFIQTRTNFYYETRIQSIQYGDRTKRDVLLDPIEAEIIP